MTPAVTLGEEHAEAALQLNVFSMGISNAGGRMDHRCEGFRRDFKTLHIPHPLNTPTETKFSSKWG